MQLSEYSVESLRDDGEFILYRGQAKQPGLPSVLLLTPTSPRPSPETLKKIDHEYSLRNELDPAWAVRPIALSERNEQVTLVLEDPGGALLDEFLSGPMEIAQFLGIAVGLTTALGGLHKRELIHKDVKPGNVLFNGATGQARLIGFGIASRLRREHQPPEPPEFIAGTLPYMAPEQTGRMNRSIDSRSDLYALGVTFYEMLTGHRPFTASEPLEWVHCHIARVAVPPHERVTTVPASVSAIVMKLLAKTPESRYRTASGVESDLRRCLSEWEAHGRIVDFSPGEHDAQDRLVLPEKLYGRAREIQALLTAFDRIVAGGRPELVLVSGYSGIGKSAVVNELHKPLVPPRGLFASGKFDQYKRDIPYATLAQALQSLIRQLLSKSEEELSRWRDTFHEALDPNGQLMVGLVPELKAIIGDQPPVPELPPQDAQRRFHLIFRRFINVFARPEHPLALFLDDLQWLDAATLDLMEELLTRPDVKHLMLIAAYRDNEVDSAHPLVRKLEAMRQAGALLHDIVLAPLTQDDLTQLIADSLHCEPCHAGPLAILVHRKTTGNPFFSIHFLSALFEAGLLTFDDVEQQWSWDLNRIQATAYADNVVELMVRKLTRLHPDTQNALQQLACLGNSAEFTMLGVVYQDSLEQLHAQLAEAVAAGFIFRLSDSYRFLHDRVQEAAYSLIAKESRAESHLRIGMLMASHTPSDKLEEAILEIVNQLNRGAHLVGSIAERERIAELNLIAGRRAKISTAYASALTYLHAARELLEDETWHRNYELVFSIEYLLAECELLTTEMAAAEHRLSMLAERAASPHDIALVARLRLTLYTAMDRSDRAVEVFLEYWRGRGTDWSSHPDEENARREYDHIWSLLGDRQIEELIDLPLMTDSDVLDVLDVFTAVVSPALFTDTRLLALVICRMVSLGLQHGNSDGLCYAYVWLGMLAGPHFGNHQAGLRFGRLGYDLVDQRGLRRYQVRTYLSFSAFVSPWMKHIKTAGELQRRCFDAANRIGDLTYAGYSCNVLNTNLLAAGDPLAEVQREAETGLEFATNIRFGLVIDYITAQLGFIRTLRGQTATFGSFNDEHFDERRFERHLANDSVLALAQCWYWIRKMQARFFAGDYPSAIEASLNAERLLWASPAFFETAEYHFFCALSHAVSFDSATGAVRQQHVDAVTAHHKQHTIWAQHCPENFENRAALVGAEMARIEGRVLEAEQLYEQAIRSAQRNGFVNNGAIAYELAARFYAARGLHKFADTYLLEARYCYQRWGADGKVAQIDQLYPHLRKESPSAPASAIVAPTELLDLATVMRVSQAVSRGMVLEPLIDSLMRAALEHAGAERGLLIRPLDDRFVIEANAATTGDTVTVHQQDAAVSAVVSLPESVVRYVIRTQHDVILDDAAGESPFHADPYIVRYRVRSILCLPLISDAKLTGVLYLENNLAARVFTPSRITVLKVLASQAAISLENSRLYRDLEDRELARNRLVAVRADVNLALATDKSVRTILQSCAEAVVKHLGAASARIWVMTRDQRFLELHAGAGMFAHFDVAHRLIPVGHSTIGVIAREATPHITNDVGRDPLLSDRELARAEGMVSFAGFPLLAGDRVVGVLAMFSRDPPSQAAVETLATLSDTIAQGIERKQAEEAIRRSEAFLAEAQALSQTGSWGWNTATGELFWSRETYRIFGFTPDIVPTLPMIVDVVHPDDRARFLSETEMASRDRTDFEHEYRLQLRDGAVKHVYAVGRFAVRGFPDLDFIGAIMNVTDRKHAAAAPLKAQSELAEVARLTTMGELAASIAHEINQPLASVVTNAQVCTRLLRAQPPFWSEVESAVSDIAEAGRRASDVIARIRLLLSKGAAEPSPLSVNEVIRDVIGLTRETTIAKRITLVTRLAPDPPPVVADRVQLQQVLVNLLTNAADAMAEINDRPRTVTISSSCDGGQQVEVAVADCGTGIDPQIRARIFEPFFTTKGDGMGMGLAICRGIVEACGGRLWATPNPDRGTTFRFAMPVAGIEGA
jgi:predicted ATPase/signal transduction histidine kinase/GAF domain-containing protein